MRLLGQPLIRGDTPSVEQSPQYHDSGGQPQTTQHLISQQESRDVVSYLTRYSGSNDTSNENYRRVSQVNLHRKYG